MMKRMKECLVEYETKFRSALAFVNGAYALGMAGSGDKRHRKLMLERLVNLAICAAEAVRRLGEVGVPEVNVIARNRSRWPIVIYGTKVMNRRLVAGLEAMELGKERSVGAKSSWIDEGGLGDCFVGSGREVGEAFEYIDYAVEMALKFRGDECFQNLVLERLVYLADLAAERIRMLEDSRAPEMLDIARLRARWPINICESNLEEELLRERLEELGLGEGLPMRIDLPQNSINWCILALVDYVYECRNRPYPGANIAWEEMELSRFGDYFLDRVSSSVDSTLLVDLEAVVPLMGSYQKLPDLSKETKGQWLDSLGGWVGVLPMRKGSKSRLFNLNNDEKTLSDDDINQPGCSTFSEESVVYRAITKRATGLDRARTDPPSGSSVGFETETNFHVRCKNTRANQALMKLEGSAFRDKVNEVIKRFLR